MKKTIQKNESSGWIGKLSVMIFLFAASLSYGQLAMTRSTFNGTYAPIYSGASNGGTLSTAAGDDVTQDNLPIGFSFNYLGTSYTTIGVSTNGWASFVGTLASASQNANTNLYTTTGPNLSIGPWWDDLTSDSIIYKTSGTPGSQVFTIQWNSKSYYFTSTQLISFQLKLYEGTNIIEFQYSPVITGTGYPSSESASIGIEGATGGNGNYLDAVTGSAFVGTAYMYATTKWPTRFFRFTPGAPTALAGGTYNVGIGQTYPTIDEAVAELNHKGISGPVTLALTQAQYDIFSTNGDNIFPLFFGPIAGTSTTNSIVVQPVSGTSTFLYDGSAAGSGNNASSTSAFGTTNEPIIGLVGAQNITIQNILLTATQPSGSLIDRGLAMINLSPAAGTQSCAIKNVTVTLNRSNTSSIGFETRSQVTPTVAGGANSNNTFMDISIANVYNGILLSGNATFPDLSNMITSSSPSIFNKIGGTNANDIGNGTSTSYGIQALNQSSVTINNNIVQNVTVNGSVLSDGIFLNAIQGVSSVYNNKVSSIKNISTTATSGITGIRANIATTGTHQIRLYNNFVAGLFSSYAGSASATRQIKGIYVQSSGGGATTQTVNVSFNNVSVDASSSPNISSTAYEIGTTSGPVIHTRNNIFANFTGAQVTPAQHITWVSTSATLLGNTGSTSNYNDLYIANTTEGYVGRGSTTNYALLANWQTGVSQDANSLSCAPGFVNNNSDLHVTSLCLDGVANMSGITWVTTDIDNTTRSVTPDIGADEFTACSSVSGGSIIPVSFQICSGQNITLNSTGSTVGGGITYAWQTSTVSGGPYSNVTAGTGSATTSYNTGSLSPGTYYFIQQVVCSVSSLTATTNEVTLTVNAVPTASISSNSPVCVGQQINFTAGTDIGTSFMWTGPGSFSSTAQNPVISSALPVNNGNYTLMVSTSNCSATAVTTSVTVNSATVNILGSSAVCLGSSATFTASGNVTTYTWSTGANTNTLSVAPTANTVYSVVGTTTAGCTASQSIAVTVTNPTITGAGTTICSGDTATLTVSAFAPVSWYASPSSTVVIGSGNTFTSNAVTTTTYYAEAVSTASSSLFTSLAGGNSSTGNMFGIVANNNIEINGFDIHVSSTIIYTVEVWYRPGTFVGFTTSNAGWTMAGTTTVTGMGTGVLTPVPMSFTVPVASGQTYGFYVTITSGSFNYTNGTTVGAVWASNSDLQLLQGNGGSYFSVTNSPRCFNGNVKYTKVGCTSPKIPVVLTVNPVPTLSVSATNATICAGGSTPMSVSGANTYTWSNNATGSVIAVSPSITTTYSVTGDLNGCIAMDSIMITVNALPSVSLSSAQSAACVNGSTIVLTGSPTGGVYTGTNVSGSVFTPGSSAGTFMPVYSVTDATTGCSSSASVSIIVNALPSVSLSASSTTACTNGSTIALTGSPSGGIYSGSNVTGSIFTPPAVSGTFSPSYSYTDANTGCSNNTNTSIIVSVCTEISKNAQGLTGLLVYPNPNLGEFTIELSNRAGKKVELSDLTGRIILTEITSNDKMNINISNLANGVYFVKIQSNNSVEIVRIIKQ